jgi:2-amino-4-hydroxy-6-hydroxymethyldihydropteridine diphosphokinase
MSARSPSRIPEDLMRAGRAEALIALGGNVGDARDILDRAVAAFCDGDMVRLLARSSDYRTPPWGVEDQPPFINACLAVSTTLAPRNLLARALEVERAFGRDRTHERRWGPRPLDIDLVAYDDVTLEGPDLTLPHPRLLERAFVLVPLAEIAPDRRISGVRIADALARLDTAGIERLPPRSGRPP